MWSSKLLKLKNSRTINGNVQFQTAFYNKKEIDHLILSDFS